LAEAGFAVFPASWHRRPATPEGKNWRELATSKTDALAALWQGREDAPGVAIATGESDVLALDFDPRSKGDLAARSWLKMHGPEWQRTVAARTPRGGLHYYFKMGGSRYGNTTGTISPGVDTKADGGYVIAPDSTCEHGNYAWIRGHSPLDMPLAPVPDWLHDLLTTNKPPTRREGKEKSGPSTQIISVLGPLAPFCVSPSPDVLRDLVRDEHVLVYLAAHIGCPDLPIGRSFHCILRRDDQNPSANLYRHESGEVLYHQWARQGQPDEWLTLSEAYAARVTGTIEKMDAPSKTVWLLRLLIEAGLSAPAPVSMRPLPVGTAGSLRTAYNAVQSLFAAKWLYGPGEATALTKRFLARWSGLQETTAQRCVHRLVDDGYLCVVGSMTASYGKTMKLYLPIAPTPDPAAAARRAGQIGATLYGVSQYDTNPPWFIKDSMKEQEQHGNDNDTHGPGHQEHAECGGD
jgi:hypothetical protein